ncbi:hypothetical protein D5F01_LYC12176 [Larimichthys crocea]|uniref:Sterile alpha motif domain-containing protein 3 n=1 Tax=Larimichthys crocea TaxID=215358 RepID=A0A6G0IAJ5_LARCR|nr:hypothetical protein D5F01_LYC12176 [Larimichthys crocea]
MKSDILDKLAEAIYAHNPYPSRDEYDYVAQALIQKHPCLKEPGSVSEWYCWKFSLKFKMGNFRQKMRVAGSSELRVNARASESAKRLKRARKSEVNFLPDFPEGKTQSVLDKERLAMISEMKKRKVDWKQIGEMMSGTFALQRKEIVEDEPLVAQVKDRWPALFSERQATDDEETFTWGMKVGVFMVKDGEDITDTAVVLEEAVIMNNQHDLPRAIALLMGLLFSLNIDYPNKLKYTFEMIQKVLMNIGGGQCSSLVHGLCNMLLRKTI